MSCMKLSDPDNKLKNLSKTETLILMFTCIVVQMFHQQNT